MIPSPRDDVRRADPLTRSPVRIDDVVLRLHRTGGEASLPPPAVMLAALDGPERGRAARTGDAGRRASFVAGRYTQRLLAAELLGVSPSRLTSRSTCPSCRADGSGGGSADHGRPGYALDGEPVPLALSLSRAPGFVLLAALDPCGPGPTPALGVDLESVLGTAFDGFDDVALTDAERHLVGGLPARHRAAARTRLWTRKEALVKALGTGFTDSDPGTVQVLGDRRIRDVSDVDGIALEPAGLAAAVAVLPGIG